MQAIDIPPENHAAIYDACAADAAGLQATVLASDRVPVLAAGENYLAKGQGNLSQVVPLVLPEGEKELLRGLYSRNLLRGSERWVYDKIWNSAKRCPYCLFGEKYELDHFLPKSDFAEFAVLPQNLVPICHPCNHKKREKKPIDESSYFIHPYFDKLPDIRWLFSDIYLADNGPMARFWVNLDIDIYGNLARRLRYHFDELELSRRFSDHAATILKEMEDVLDQYLATRGPAVVAAHFGDEGERLFRVHGNCIEAAVFQAASLNYNYCAGGYRN